MRKHAAGLAVLVLVTIVAAQDSSSSATSQGRGPALGEILDSMEQSQLPNRGPYQPYTITRKYALFRDEHQRPISEVTAEISSVLPGKKNYEIKRASGNRIGKKIVHKILDWETESVKDESAISRHNYDFGFLRDENLDSYPTYVLSIVAKRKRKDLFNGEVWIDAKTFRVRRIEGTLAQKPSWWVRQHHIVLQFGEVKGVWIHTSTEVTAIIRIFGKYMLTAQEVDLTLIGRVGVLSRTLADSNTQVFSRLACAITVDPQTTANSPFGVR